MITVDKYNVRIVRKGDTYGREFCLTYDKDEPMVEFYDGRYPHCKFGQFVSRYNVATILGTDGWGRGEGGLILDGGNVNEWTVQEKDMATVREYLRTETDQAPKVMVWFGMMEHGKFGVTRYDIERMVIIHSIDEKVLMDPNEIENHLALHHYDSYIVPSEFVGYVTYSSDYIRNMP
jgi:hypothetical protein